MFQIFNRKKNHCLYKLKEREKRQGEILIIICIYFFLIQKIACIANESVQYCGPKNKTLFIELKKRYGKDTNKVCFKLKITAKKDYDCNSNVPFKNIQYTTQTTPFCFTVIISWQCLLTCTKATQTESAVILLTIITAHSR